MMATTHVLVGLAVAAVVTVAAPEHGLVAAGAAVAGGAAPDLDLYAGHRRTLHFPVYLPVLALLAVPVAVAVPTAPTVAAAVFLVAAGLHCAMDAWGGGLELKPWVGESERAVFSHYHGAWLAPRRLVRYDGAPEDLLLAGVAAVPVLAVFGSPVDEVVVGVLALSAVYTALRKPMVWAGEWAVDRLPADVVGRVPDRFLGDLAPGAEGSVR